MNLVLYEVEFALTVAPVAIASLHLICGHSLTDVTHTTPVTPESSAIGSGAACVAKVDREATIPTPRYLRGILGGFTAGTLPAWGLAKANFRGGIVIKPGAFVAIGALTAVTGFGSMLWAERPIGALPE